jgi:predicted nucleic acid-binding protein
MMKNKISNLSKYTFSNGEKILIDTNIWIYLFPPPCNTQSSFVKNYSYGFQRLIKASAKPVLDSAILSEYLNTYSRIEWEGSFKMTYPVFKKFRRSNDFSSVSSTAAAFAKKIVKLCDTHETSANELDLLQAINSFESGSIDFNDAILVDVCQKHGFKLMTNDGDFETGGIEILTSNPKLLRKQI